MEPQPAREPHGDEAVCGHLFCEGQLIFISLFCFLVHGFSLPLGTGCFNEMVRTKAECAVCREKIKEDGPKKLCFASNAKRREIMNLKTHCSLQVEGCDWRGTLRELLSEHQGKCGYTGMMNCSFVFLIYSLAHHVHNPIFRVLIAVMCDGCHAQVQRRNMIIHATTECARRSLPCLHCHVRFA